jgi:hypothetical protein
LNTSQEAALRRQAAVKIREIAFSFQLPASSFQLPAGSPKNENQKNRNWNLGAGSLAGSWKLVADTNTAKKENT